MHLVGDHELAAGDIGAHFSISGPAVSQHLRVLEDAGLMDERRQGTRRLYRVRPETLAQLRAYLEDFWGQGLERLKRVAETEERHNRGRRSSGRCASTPRQLVGLVKG